MSDKDLPPTYKRLRDARAEGNFARSEMLTGLGVSVLAAEAVFACADAAVERWLLLQHTALAQVGSVDRIAACLALVGRYAGWIVIAFASVAAAAVAATLLAAWLCGGLAFAPKTIRPSLKRLNAVQHIKGLFGKKNLTAVALAATTGCVVAAVAYWQLRIRLPVVSAMIDWQSLAFDREIGSATLHAFIRIVLGALLLPAVLSAALARGQRRRALRMSQRELKDELKQTSGDPSMRARQRMSSSETVAVPSVGDAQCGNGSQGRRALIVDPAHFAVLLDDKGDTSAPPIVIGKATGEEAMQITNSALLEHVVVFRFCTLARYLYRHGELQLAIPRDCYRAVAIVYRIVEETQRLEGRPNVPIEIADEAFDPQRARA